MLFLISEKYNKKDFGRQRDDSLVVVKNKSGLLKNIQKIWKEYKLDIVIQCNMKRVNHLDVSPNLNNLNYKPYYKPDSKIYYKDSKRFKSFTYRP